MRVEIRTTGQGTEYWDNIEKRTIFVPTGKKPNFEVTKNPKSMVAKKETADSKEKIVDEDKNVNDALGVNDGEKDYQLMEMTVKDLKKLAADNEIEIPKDVTKKEDIANYIFENWTTE